MYIILHKVRGEPAFDVAERCDDMGTESDPGPWWIIPTSGHRAYPYRTWALDYNRYEPEGIPAEWPDHYQTSRHEPKQSIDIGQLLSGLMPKMGSFKRRA